MEIFQSPARFRAVAAGRRFGKSYLSAIELLIHALKDETEDGISLEAKDVFYIAPTFQQAKDIMWDLLKSLGKGVIVSVHENTGVLKLVNGRKIHLKGSDREDTLRGVGLSFVVLDEYASMKPNVWNTIIRPTLADVQGRALFIGTPAGKNHFYDLFVDHADDDTWELFTYLSKDNPFIPDDEVEAARKTMSAEIFKQEFEASFQSFGSKIFKADEVSYMEKEPEDGYYYMTVDPAGYEDVANPRGKSKKLDETAIAVVKVGTFGWYVADMIHGRWGVRETSIKILQACREYKPMVVGIEKGSLKNALMPYMEDQMKRLGVFPHIVDVTHGGKEKTKRITWALQGRFQHGRIYFKRNAAWNQELIEQMIDFPNQRAHDDMLDALAYIDQIANVVYADNVVEDTWEPQDWAAGY